LEIIVYNIFQVLAKTKKGKIIMPQAAYILLPTVNEQILAVDEVLAEG